jgi:hypothetical protein
VKDLLIILPPLHPHHGHQTGGAQGLEATPEQFKSKNFALQHEIQAIDGKTACQKC